MLENKKIGFIGAGVMGKAIIGGLIESGYVKKENIFASEINQELANKVSSELGISASIDNNKVAESSDILFICTKPFIIKKVLEDISNSLGEKTLVISIAAGVSSETIENSINKSIPVIRTMPNTPVLVKEGMVALCRGKHATDEHIELTKNLFEQTGKCIEVPEKLINAVTGISGSGPAFMYLIIEALADGGVKKGLPKKTAIELAAQTALGAAKMVLETGKHPAILKDEVTTPGGTTIAGLMTMEEHGVRSALAKTVQSTAEKADELG